MYLIKLHSCTSSCLFEQLLTTCLYCPRYSTAYAESDYTDRDTDREEGGEREPEQESEEEEDKSCATVLTLRQEDSQDEDLEDDRDPGVEDRGPRGEQGAGVLQHVTEVPSGELALLLAQSDILHTGDSSLKAEGYRLLRDSRAEVSRGTRVCVKVAVRQSAHGIYETVRTTKFHHRHV